MTDQQTSTFSLYEEVRARPVDSDGCWLYAGKMNAYGYGFITSGRKLRAMAHRAMYETIIGPIPEGLQLDHLCRVTQCINPDHLEPVTPRVNVLRSHSVTSAKARQTHCKRGHPFNDRNTYRHENHRRCRVCMRDLRRERYRKLRREVAS